MPAARSAEPVRGVLPLGAGTPFGSHCQAPGAMEHLRRPTTERHPSETGQNTDQVGLASHIPGGYPEESPNPGLSG